MSLQMDQQGKSARLPAGTGGSSAAPGTSLSEIGRIGRTSAGVARFAALWAVLLILSALGTRLFRSWAEEVGSTYFGVSGNIPLSSILVLLCIGILAVALRSRSTRISLAAGAVLVAVLSFSQGISTAFYIGSGDPLLVRPTWNSVMVLVFSLVVTAPVTYHLAVIALITMAPAVSTGILGLFGAFSEGQLEGAKILDRLVLASIPTWICAAMALFGVLAQAAVQRRLRRAERDLEDARGELSELGSYTLERKIGSGGMGEVWKARHRTLARPAAIKLVKGSLLQSASGDEEEYERICSRFEREARVTAQLTSPHTVQVYDYGRTEDGSLYYVMELLEGTDLEALVKKEGPQSQERTALFLLQALDSLAEAHARGLVHRDIKPANLFLTRQGLNSEVLKVLDFGLALARRPSADGKGATRITKEGMITGTPLYMSPEQARGVEDLDGRVDLYSLGCAAWFLLTGHPVFEHESPVDVIVDHLQKAPGRLKDEVKGPLDPGLEDLVLRLLEKDRALRPTAVEAAQTMAALGLHLRAAPVFPPRPIEAPAEAPAEAPPAGDDQLTTRILLRVRPGKRAPGPK